MPTIKKLSSLFRALAEQRVDSASSIAEEIVKEEEQKGHHSAARALRGSLRQDGVGARPSAPTQIASTILPSALVRLGGDIRLDDVRLRTNARAELQHVVIEWRNAKLLESKKLGRRSKLAFFGPSGCGKSLAAQALGNELSVPTYLVRFDAVIGAYLGQTAIHLRELFRFANTTPCVLLFDEVDALGKRRGNPLDVGELDRIVIAFMQELEHSHPRGLIVATSNLPTHLDDALWRRFDLAVEFAKPTRSELCKFGKDVAAQYKLANTSVLNGSVGKANSYAEAEAIVRAASRRELLGELAAKNAPKKRSSKT